MGLSIEKIHFSYEDVQVLRDVSFTVNTPGLVGIIGPNGSGKSTLIKNILDFLQPDSGRVMYNCRSVSELNLIEKARTMSYVPQSITPNFSHTVFYTVLMGRKPYIGWSYAEDDKAVAENTLKQMNLYTLRNRMFSTLSGGEKQKVLLARAIAQDCELMLLDEPTSNLDLRHQQEVLTYLCRLSIDNQVTILMVIHDLNLASMFCDRLIMFNEGEKVVEGAPSQVITKELMKSVYNVDVEIIYNEDKPHILLRPQD